MKRRLLQLQLKFSTSELIDLVQEREEMEKLQNKVKTSNGQLAISGDKDLQQLFATNCKYIQSAMTDVNLLNKSQWLKFKELMFSFRNFYFHA